MQITLILNLLVWLVSIVSSCSAFRVGVFGVAPKPSHRATLFSHKCGSQIGRHTCG
jgi:hypothetical protein